MALNGGYKGALLRHLNIGHLLLTMMTREFWQRCNNEKEEQQTALPAQECRRRTAAATLC
jgi:hypothetical protein